jgi:hypothetical protein
VPKYAIIRDDDANFFTSPNMLEEIYEEIFALHLPVSCSVIPCIETGRKLKNIRYRGVELSGDPFIPEKYHDTSQRFFVYENSELVEFIKNSKDHIHLLQHGFSHSRHEFLSMNFGEMNTKLLTGKKVLQQTFNEVPRFFCAPYDVYSSVSLFLLKKYFWGATYGEMTLKSMFSPRVGLRLSLDLIPSFVNASMTGCIYFMHDAFLLLGHDGRTCINPFENSFLVQQEFKKYAESQKVIMIVLHHWEFFYDKVNNSFRERINREALDAFMEELQWLKDKGTEFLTVLQFYKKLS